jgi:hypothetical protein
MRADDDGDLRFSVANAGFGVAAAITIGLGYWLLSQGSIAAAPILLVIGYVVLAPLAVLL